MANYLVRQALELQQRWFSGMSPAAHAHNCGDTPSGRHTYRAALKRFDAGRPCVADLRLALTPNASRQIKSAACRWAIHTMSWSSRPELLASAFVPAASTAFPSCHGCTPAREALRLVLTDPKLTDEQLSWFAAPLILQLGSIWAAAIFRPNAYPEQLDAEAARNWCLACLEQIRQLPNAGPRYIASCAIAVVEQCSEVQEHVRCAIEGIAPEFAAAAFALGTPDSDLDHLIYTVRLFLA